MIEGSKFYEDLSNFQVENEISLVLTQIYEAEKRNPGAVACASKKGHIIDQWLEFHKLIPEIDDAETPVFFRLVRRAALAPNAQSGCERANLQYNLAKTNLSSSMGIPMIQSRLRIHINGPPLSKFNAEAARIEWIKNGHQYAETIAKNQLVIQRIRKKDDNYDCKIFD